MERQYLVFIVAASALFGALVVYGLFFWQGAGSDGGNGGQDDDPTVIKARVGEQVHIRYGSTVVKQIQNLPSKNSLTLVSSSELHNVNLAALDGELRFTGRSITYTDNGETKTEDYEDFKPSEYAYSPDKGTNTTYTYENLKFAASKDSSQLVATFKPLPEATVGDRYTVNILLKDGVVGYAFKERVVEIIE